MASVNKVILVGNLGADPEAKYLPSGDAVANVSLATSETWKDKTTGERKEATEWHRLVFFGRLAEVVTQHLKKGSSIYIEGSIKTRKWQDKDGQDRYSTEIKVSEMKMLGGKSDGDGAGGRDSNNGGAPRQQRPAQQPGQQRKPSQEMDDDIPF